LKKSQAARRNGLPQMPREQYEQFEATNAMKAMRERNSRMRVKKVGEQNLELSV
jgi:hypothetical protein